MALTVDKLIDLIVISDEKIYPTRCIGTDEYMVRKKILTTARDNILDILRRDHWARLSAFVPRVGRVSTINKVIWRLSADDDLLARYITRLKSIIYYLRLIDQMLVGRIDYEVMTYEDF